MKNSAIALFLLAIIVSACQKEPSFQDPNSLPGGGATTSTGLLMRSVQATATDSSVSFYSYDASKRLSQMDIADSQFSIFTRIVRNASGIITQYILKSPDFASIGIDSLVTNVFYDNTLARYTYMRFDLNLGGIPLSDSSVFSYSAGGTITNRIDYSKSLVGGFKPSSRTDYVYAGGNVSVEKSYDFNGATYDLGSTTTYGYDAKVSPLKIGNEALVIGNTTLFGANNITSVNYVDATDPTNNTTQAYTYSYNALNKPSGGTSVSNPGAVNSTLRFYYN